jgi:hypothetical protein
VCAFVLLLLSLCFFCECLWSSLRLFTEPHLSLSLSKAFYIPLLVSVNLSSFSVCFLSVM